MTWFTLSFHFIMPSRARTRRDGDDDGTKKEETHDNNINIIIIDSNR
jgi:hypothetical protein